MVEGHVALARVSRPELPRSLGQGRITSVETEHHPRAEIHWRADAAVSGAAAGGALPFLVGNLLTAA
jgi:hypothetical protein